MGFFSNHHSLQGPHFPEPLETPADCAKLNANGAVDRLKYVGEAITMMRHKLNGKVPLIGFTGAPVSLNENMNSISYRVMNSIDG